MHADLSRDTFDPARRFTRVLMQQGRVTLDADLNEQSAILLYFLRRLAADLIGPFGGPAGDELGFAVTPNGTLLQVGPGRYYVDGILVESADTLEISGYEECRRENGNVCPPCLVYLDVWERHVTALQDERIREVALGGPDTATRSQVMWRVGVWPVPINAAMDRDAVWRSFRRDADKGAPGSLKAMAESLTPDTHDHCILPPDARFRGLENQLYRVEIHTDGSTAAGETAPTFKWSRQNGSVVFSLRSLQGAEAEVKTLGLDTPLALSPGDWVEITDDERAGRGERFLVQVVDVDRDDLRVTLDDRDTVELPQYGPDDAGRHPMMRRWDHSAPVTVTRDSEGTSRRDLVDGAIRVEPGWIDVEDGVRVRFLPNAWYTAGDHWLIPARVATADVEWARNEAGDPVWVTARREEHHYAPLAILRDDNTVEDWRSCITPLCGPCGRL